VFSFVCSARGTRFDEGGAAPQPALVQEVTFDTISENWALENQQLAPLKKAIGDLLHRSLGISLSRNSAK
jgi:hypothetical protein